MLKVTHARRGMVVAPHHLAAEAGRDVLKAGGNAVEAMIAAAATIAVVYPHMNAVGGDGFWLIHEPGKPPVAIDACGPSAGLANREYYAGLEHIPSRGGRSALTVAGAIGGWMKALQAASAWGAALPVAELLQAAIGHARHGSVVSRSQASFTAIKRAELQGVPGFAEVFLPGGCPPQEGDILYQPALAATLTRLAEVGLDDFYRGEIARQLAADLEAVGSPLRLADLQAYSAQLVEPLSVRLQDATVYNLPPPTQGLASLLILGLFDRLGVTEPDSFDHVPGLIECTKQAFMVRDRVVTDPGRLPADPAAFLAPASLARRASLVSRTEALPWPQPAKPGDTVWMGAMDACGRSVSYIQSIYWEFGSGVVLPSSGVTWQNRGIAFSLDPASLNVLEPGRKPFHTLNPALARFDDGRVLSYGTMGGEGQPQTQAAVLSRYRMGCDLQAAITAPRWLLGRTWGAASTNLKFESRTDPALIDALRHAGHDIEVLEDGFSDVMGHAGAIVRRSDGTFEGAVDPRSDGKAAAL